MDERLRFVARLLDGEKMAAVCADFGISRKTGYKIYDRYKEAGLHGFVGENDREARATTYLADELRMFEIGSAEIGRPMRPPSGREADLERGMVFAGGAVG